MGTTAFITGVTGQDGSYLTELLLSKGYTVHGLVHSPEKLRDGNLASLVADRSLIDRQLFLYTGSLEDTPLLTELIRKTRPDEFYHLAGVSSPRYSLQHPEETLESIGMSTLRLLEVLRHLTKPPKFLFASSSEAFGAPPYAPQDEMVPLHPSTPYGAAKAFAMQMARIYRTAYGLPTCSAILYNHESPRRSDQFVTVKVARAAARISKGRQEILTLGNLSGMRDWGWAPEYVEGMWMMLQQEAVDDFVLATGKIHSVEELVQVAFRHVNLEWRKYVQHSPELATKVEPMSLCGNPSKAHRLLGWKARVGFREMVERLVDAEVARLEAE